ncbi:hypothetical protein E2C01_074998 [Portunus trituberculatus]|uniref:Uncharacterized protein n=1 Tax=Portunus trituberculatus TaxID=210409 RepID=A0A5B7IF08_PORTR|nr:hypothetical protein [Portunus trituberculatus]
MGGGGQGISEGPAVAAAFKLPSSTRVPPPSPRSHLILPAPHSSPARCGAFPSRVGVNQTDSRVNLAREPE